MREPSKFASPAAQAVLKLLLDALAVGPVTMTDLIAASGKSPGRARDYIMHLRATDRIFCMAEAISSFDGSMPSIWALNPDFAEPDAGNVMDDSYDTCPQRVIIRSSWPPHHFRMPMDCLLFGVPAAMQAAA